MNIQRWLYIFIIAALALSSCNIQGGLQTTITPDSRSLTATNAAKFPTKTPIPTVIPTPTISAHLQITPTALQGVTIQFWHPFSGETATQFEELIYEYNQTNIWGVRVQSLAAGSSGNLYSMVKTSLGENSIPSVIAAPQEFLRELLETDNILVDINQYIRHPVWGMDSEEIEAFVPEFWELDQDGDRRFGFPILQNPHVLFYNTTWASELGYENAPATTVDFQKQVCAATKANTLNEDKADDGMGGWIIDTSGLTMFSWMSAFGFNEQSENALHFSSAETEKTFSYLRRMYDQDCIWQSRLPQYDEYFANRQTILYSGTLTDLAPQLEANRRLNNDDEWKVIPYPSAEGDEPSIISSGYAYGILATGPEEQLATWLLVRWLSLPENSARLVTAAGAWPVNRGADEIYAAYGRRVPQWEDTLNWIGSSSIVVPDGTGWRQARIILEDAAWHLFQTNFTVDQIPDLLEMLDETIQEVGGKKPD